MRSTTLKVTLVLTAAACLVGPVLAWVYVDAPTGAFFLVASVVVCVCATMPVVFGVVTRRSGPRRSTGGEVREIRLGDRPSRDAPVDRVQK